jgi:polysaccharide biosynthesis protein PslG
MRRATDNGPFVRRLTALAAAAILVVLLAVPSAEAKGSSFFGLNYSFRDMGGKDVRKLKASGAKTVRWAFFWARLEHFSGRFNWDASDKVVGDLASKGIRVLPILYGTPSWVAKSPNKAPIGSQKARDAWKQFLQEAVKRYGPNGSYWAGPYRVDHPGKAAAPIQTWQVWNEPNLKSHWAPHPDPGDYAKLLKISDSAIKGADSSAKVMFAGMPGYSNDIDAWDYMRRIYKKQGVRNDFDLAAIHPYGHTIHQMLAEMERVRKVMRKSGDGNKPMWVTEVGWGSLPENATPYHLTKGMKGQAKILKQAFHALKNKRHKWHIKKVLWFNFRDPGGGGVDICSFCSSAGLLKNNYKPKPSWNAFRKFTR